MTTTIADKHRAMLDIYRVPDLGDKIRSVFIDNDTGSDLTHMQVGGPDTVQAAALLVAWDWFTARSMAVVDHGDCRYVKVFGTHAGAIFPVLAVMTDVGSLALIDSYGDPDRRLLEVLAGDPVQPPASAEPEFLDDALAHVPGYRNPAHVVEQPQPRVWRKGDPEPTNTVLLRDDWNGDLWHRCGDGFWQRIDSDVPMVWTNLLDMAPLTEVAFPVGTPVAGRIGQHLFARGTVVEPEPGLRPGYVLVELPGGERASALVAEITQANAPAAQEA